MNPDRIREILQMKLGASAVEVEDESGLHAGHAGAKGGGGHYRVTVIAEVFSSKSSIERHRMVYAALADEMGKDIHALALKTLAPGEG